LWHIDLLAGEIAALDRRIAEQKLAIPGFRRLLTIPGVDVGTAAAVIAAVGDTTRFESPHKLVAYLGLDPRVRQSGAEPARYGHISKREDPHARAVLVEAAWSAIRNPGPLRAFGERVPAAARRSRRSPSRASWRCSAVHLLPKDRDYAYVRPSLVCQKTRRRELVAGAPALARRYQGAPASPTAKQRAADKELQHQAELAYRRLIANRRAAAPKGGAGATPGRASSGPSKGPSRAAGHKP